MILTIQDYDIKLLKIFQPDIITIKYIRSFAKKNEVFVKCFIDNIGNFPNLKNFYVVIKGSNYYDHDLVEFEKLFFLFEKDSVENIRISNGHEVLYKENGEIGAHIPYKSSINLHPKINNVEFATTGYHSSSIVFEPWEMLNNLPISVKKITFCVSFTLIKEGTIKILGGQNFKLPFGTELFLKIDGCAYIKNIIYLAHHDKLNIISSKNIIFNEEILKNTNLVFV
jgi:hypothetical protein